MLSVDRGAMLSVAGQDSDDGCGGYRVRLVWGTKGPGEWGSLLVTNRNYE